MTVQITVFTGNDLNSRGIVKVLQNRNLEFQKICLCLYPCKLQDLKALTGTVAVPRVFFGTREIGGLEDTLRELRRMDDDPKLRKRIELASFFAANEKKLSLPDIPPTFNSCKSLTLLPCIELPDGTTTTFYDITEKIKNSIPMPDMTIKGSFYKKVFTGKDALITFESSLKISREQAQAFGNALLQAQVFHHVGNCSKTVKTLDGSDKAFYRLQCYMTPDVLNSYRKWTDSVHLNCTDILDSLDDQLNKIEEDSLDYNGMLDCTKAEAHSEFPLLEECVCQLQEANVADLSNSERLAFGLNLYRFMIRYATIKIGIPISACDRLHFLKNVKFNIGGLIFSFQEFLDGILRGNNRSPFLKPLSDDDLRTKLTLPKRDHRIHFAVNSGSMVGAVTNTPFGKYTASNVNEQLDLASKTFWEDARNFGRTPKTSDLTISKVLDWYRVDFSSNNRELLAIISPHLSGYQRCQLPTSSTKKFKLNFIDAIWTKNAINFKRYYKDAVVANLNGMKYAMNRFMRPKIPENEKNRIAVLKSLNILDTLPEEKYDRITRMTKHYFGVPIVLLSLIDSERQWFKSVQWNCHIDAVNETSRDVSFCAHAINQEDSDLFVVNDTFVDDRFADNPLAVGDLKLRFYAGCVLVLPDANGGNVEIGTICLLDQRPREFSEEDKSALRNFASMIKEAIMDSQFQTVPFSETRDLTTGIPSTVVAIQSR